jgi:ankyrin repeat protein
MIEHAIKLIELGADVNAIDKDQMTPLDYCMDKLCSNLLLENVNKFASMIAQYYILPVISYNYSIVRE